MTQNLNEPRQLLNRVKLWVAVACMLAAILIGYFAVQGFRYWQAWSRESSLAKEINVLDRKIDAVSPVGDLEERLEALKVRLRTEDPKLKGGELLFEARKLLLGEKIQALKQQLAAKELVLEDRNLQLEQLTGLFHYPSADDLLKIVANTVQETGLNLMSIASGELETETVGAMTYQVRRVGLTLN